MRDDASPRRPPFEQQGLSTLAATTMSDLFEAGMIVVMEVVRARVLNRGADRLFEQVRDDDGRWHLRYRPMVELLLLHISDLARREGSREERECEILWALEAAGF